VVKPNVNVKEKDFMNREIKFRVCYTAQNGEKSIINSNDNRYLIGLNGTLYENYGTKEKPMWESIFDAGEPPTIQQYTGLKDKNGKEIYEGDIVSVYDPENLFVVLFGKVERNVIGYDNKTIFPLEINGFYFKALDNNKAYFSITRNTMGEHDLKGTEIVGNIYENKELLK
jgi:uncharacterized phage protein (TIGR01671 family)